MGLHSKKGVYVLHAYTVAGRGACCHYSLVGDVVTMTTRLTLLSSVSFATQTGLAVYTVCKIQKVLYSLYWPIKKNLRAHHKTKIEYANNRLNELKWEFDMNAKLFGCTNGTNG